MGRKSHCGREKSRCSANTSLPCPIGKSRKVVSGDDSRCGQGHRFKFFEGEIRVSHEPAGCQVLPPQSNPRAKVARPGEARSEPM